MSEGVQQPDGSDVVREVAEEARRHLRWLLDAGQRVVELAPRVEDMGRPAPTGASAVRPAPAERPPAIAARELPASDLAAAEAPVEVAAPALPPRDACGEGAPRPGGEGDARANLARIRADLGDCTRCKLAGGRTQLVFGVGDPAAALMFVGEGPGADEDRQGEPFVGKAGQLLTKMIEAMGYRREEVYIANVVKCRPPNNRDPEPDEVAACEPFLKRQIAAVAPKVIVALGRVAVQTLLRDPSPISRQRGRWREYEGVRLMPTFHPAYLLRSPAEKRKAWEDLQLVMRELGKPLPR